MRAINWNVVTTRECFICQTEKPMELFGNSKAERSGKLFYCKSCALGKNKTHRKKPATKIKMRERSRKEKYGLTAAAFKSMFDSQNGECAVCKTSMDFLARSTCVDHDHETGLIREILCQKCNLGLGHFCDSIENMRKAIAYLEKHSQELIIKAKFEMVKG